MATVRVLPEEVVAHILGFLSLPDRKSASLACRHWLRASRHPALMRDVVLDAGSCLSDAAASKSGSILPSEWKPLVRSLALGSNAASSKSSSALSWRQLADTLDGCHRLVSVDLSGCDGLCLARDLLSDESQRKHLRQQLVGVRQLSLSGLTRLTATGLRRFIDLFPSLESLNLRGCSLVCSNSIAMASVMADASVLTFGAVLHVVQQCCIAELDLSCTDVTDSALELLAGVDNLHLRSVSLDSCRLLEGRGLSRLIANQRANLRRLSVAKNRHLRVSQSTAVANQLNDLIAPGSSNLINDRFLVATASASLTVLDVSDCNQISERALTTALTAARNLRWLALARCSAFTDAVVGEALTAGGSLKSLEHLDASSCSGFTDVGLRLVCGHLANSLRGLRLAWLRGVTDWGLLGLPQPKAKDADVSGSSSSWLLSKSGRRGEQFPHYKRAVDVGEPKYAAPSLDELRSHLSRSVDNSAAAIGPNYSLERLHRLRLLDLSNCPKVTAVGLDEIFHANKFPFPDLEELHLLGNRHVNDSHLFCLASGASSLRQLHLSGSMGLSDAGLAMLTNQCHRLRSLGLANCDNLTDQGLPSLVGVESLRSLDLSYCARISHAGLDLLARRAPRITELRGLWTGTELMMAN